MDQSITIYAYLFEFLEKHPEALRQPLTVTLDKGDAEGTPVIEVLIKEPGGAGVVFTVSP